MASLSSARTSSHWLLLVVFTVVCCYANGQSLQVTVDGLDLYTSEASDCSGGADPEWRVRVSINSGSTFVNWDEGRTNIQNAGYQGIASSGLIVNGAATLTDNFVIELDAFEDDDFACDIPFNSGGPNDGECGGYGGTINELMTSKPACTNNQVEIIRSCSSDGSTIEWRALVRYNYQYNHGDAINCNPNPPTPSPTRNPTRNPTRQPTPVPTNLPTNNPTFNPTRQPTSLPTSQPTSQPTSLPTPQPTEQPTAQPTAEPTTATPTAEPTFLPTQEPTANPTNQPTFQPTAEPTLGPTSSPTSTDSPTSDPTRQPTEGPSASPTTPAPTSEPTSEPTTRAPTSLPTSEPTNQPTSDPTSLPTPLPSAEPTTRSPTVTGATSEPSVSPTTAAPSASPSTPNPTNAPSSLTTEAPTSQPSNTASPTTPVPTQAPVVPSPGNSFEGGAVLIGAGCAAIVGLSALAFLLVRQRRKGPRSEGKVVDAPPQGHGEATRNPFYVGGGSGLQHQQLTPMRPPGPPPGF